MRRRIGVHISIAGGIDKGLEHAARLGCSTVQLFSHNPRGWALGSRKNDEVRQFRKLKKELDICPVYIHTSYLINLASSRKDLLDKSVDMIIAELDIADNLGAEYVVLHTGSASGDDPSSARKRATEALVRIADRGVWKAGLLLENTAGERGDITSRMPEIAEIINSVPEGLIAGICFDTCHAFSAGYDIGSEHGVGLLTEEIETYIGIENLRLIHLNDSKKILGAGVDRHEHIGEGKIGKKGLKYFLGNSLLGGIPLILETPKKSDEDDIKNLAVVRSILGD